MDPASALALAVTINDILSKLFTIGKDLKDGPEELSRLCAELFALQAALNHVAMNMRFASTSSGAFPTALLGTEQFEAMMSSANSLLQDLLKRLQRHDTGFKATLKHRLTWAWSKDDIKEYVVRLEHLKTYFTLVTTSNNFELSRKLYEELHSIKSVQDQESRNRLRSELKKWLGVYDCQPLHDEALAARQAGTGKWFLEGHFSRWSSFRDGIFHDADTIPLLWLRGKSGSGKTTMLSSAINDYATRSSGSHDPRFAFFYCTFKILSTQDPNVVLASLIAQLCDQRPNLWSDLVEKYRKATSKGGQRSPKLSLEELQDLLVEAIKPFGEVCLFLDAPNESVQAWAILESLARVMVQHSGVRLCVTSTPDLEIRAITKFRIKCLSINMEESGMRADIEAYVANSLGAHDVFKDLSQIRNHIREGIMSRANGSFRWVDCQLRSLALQDTVAEMEDALDLLSDSLEDHYQNILLAIPTKTRNRAKMMLFWLTFQLRPMTSKELAEAIILEDNMRDAIDHRHRLVPGKIEYFIRICRSLVNHDVRKDTVSLAHSSVKAYLISSSLKQSQVAAEFSLDERSAQIVLVRLCLQYLLQPPFHSGYCETGLDKNKRYAEWPLFKYCANSWPVYLLLMDNERIELDTKTQQLLLSFLETRHMPRGGCYAAWLQYYLPTHLNGGQKRPLSTPLNIAARAGLNVLVKLILNVEGKKDLETPGGSTLSTPLHRACAFGHIEVVKTLLAAGANVHEVNRRGLSGTYWANRLGRKDIVRLMLESGVDPKCIKDDMLIIPSRTAGLKDRSRDDAYATSAWDEQGARSTERQGRNLGRSRFEPDDGVFRDEHFVGHNRLTHDPQAVDPRSHRSVSPGPRGPDIKSHSPDSQSENVTTAKDPRPSGEQLPGEFQASTIERDQ